MGHFLFSLPGNPRICLSNAKISAQFGVALPLPFLSLNTMAASVKTIMTKWKKDFPISERYAKISKTSWEKAVLN